MGVDAQFAVGTTRAGLYVHHYELFRAMGALGQVDTTLFLNQWALPQDEAPTIAGRVSDAFGGIPTTVASIPGRFRSLRMSLSPLGRLDVFYHVFGGTFEPIPNVANAYLVSDLIPLVVDDGIAGFRESSLAYYRRAIECGDVLFVSSEHGGHGRRRGRDPHPYVVGAGSIARYLTVAEECAKAGLLRVK